MSFLHVRCSSWATSNQGRADWALLNSLRASQQCRAEHLLAADAVGTEWPSLLASSSEARSAVSKGDSH